MYSLLRVAYEAQVIVSCGYWDNSIRCYNVDDGRLLQSLRQHKDIVTCIAVGSDGCTLVSGAHLYDIDWKSHASSLIGTLNQSKTNAYSRIAEACTCHLGSI